MAKSVMIVDDAAFMRMKLKDILEKNGYSVVAEAQNGVEAIEKYKEVRPEIVTMDIMMPEMDGIEALKGIKGIDANAKVVMCSAMGQLPIVIHPIRPRPADFIVKPFVTDPVIKALDKVN